jgi:hypothetical protein
VSKKPARRKKIVTIFLSYASEDASLAATLEDELKRVFPFGLRVFMDKSSINVGDNFRAVIDEELDGADILLLVFTNQPKTSHSYTGYEVGFFSRSKAQRPHIVGDIERLIIPFCVGSGFPDTADYMQGVDIDRNDIFSLVEEPGAFRSEPRGVADDNPVLKMFTRIADITTRVTGLGADPGALRRNIRESAQRVYEVIFAYLQSRVYSERFPERKIIIRTGTPPRATDDETLLSDATIELAGRSFDLFGIPEPPSRAFNWPDFIEQINPPSLASTWSGGIKLMVGACLKGDFGGNFHVVSTLKRDRAFRMFVSRIVTYYSGQTEVHIYIVEIKTRDYGDEETTRLLKAISVGLRFRFLVLESQSPFTPDNLRYVTVDLRPKVTELLQQMDLILREARDARLDEPDILRRIYGDDGPSIVKRNMELWVKASRALYAAAHKLLSAGEQGNDIVGERESFVESLATFAKETEAMNRDFTSKALMALADEVSRRVGPVARTAA